MLNLVVHLPQLHWLLQRQWCPQGGSQCIMIILDSWNNGCVVINLGELFLTLILKRSNICAATRLTSCLV